MPPKKHLENQPLTEEELQKISSETNTIIRECIESFVTDDNKKEFTFPPTFSNTDRRLVHFLAAEAGLKSKSFGKGKNRSVKIFKDAGSIMSCFYKENYSLELSDKSLEVINKYLQSLSLNLDEEGSSELDYKDIKVNDKFFKLGRNKPVIPKTTQLRFKQKLPIWDHADEISREIENGRVSIIVGETGSGKTTQIPQLILEDSAKKFKKCQIICSLPRRVAAVTVSERVAWERGEEVGKTVGYQIKHGSRISSKTILTFCTNGILLRAFMGGDKWLSNITHIILDEVHERDKITDFLIIVMKDLLAKFTNLKLIIMSATIEHDKYIKYFQNVPEPGDTCKAILVRGRLFDVKEVYLEDILIRVQVERITSSPENYFNLKSGG